MGQWVWDIEVCQALLMQAQAVAAQAVAATVEADAAAAVAQRVGDAVAQERPRTQQSLRLTLPQGNGKDMPPLTPPAKGKGWVYFEARSADAGFEHRRRTASLQAVATQRASARRAHAARARAQHPGHRATRLPQTAVRGPVALVQSWMPKRSAAITEVGGRPHRWAFVGGRWVRCQCNTIPCSCRLFNSTPR